MVEDSSERSRRAVMLGVPVAIAGTVTWSVYGTVKEAVEEKEAECREKYGEDNYTIKIDDSNDAAEEWKCVPDEQ